MKLTKHKVVLYQYIPLMSFIVTKLKKYPQLLIYR